MTSRFYKYYLTYGASLLNRVRRCTPIDKTLFITRFDGLGDLFLLLPFLHALIGKGYHLTMTGARSQREVLDYCGLHVKTFPFDDASPESIKCSLASAAAVRPTHAINLSMSIWGGILVNHTRAPVLAGLVQERQEYVYKGTTFFYDRTFTFEPSCHGFDAIARVLDTLLGIGPVTPFFNRPPAAGPEIVVHPYARWKPREWPYYSALIRTLITEGYSVTVIGTPEEHANGRIAAALPNSDQCSVVALGSVTDILRAIEHGRAFIGNDSGPAHYASLIGRPTFVLWGPGNFERVRMLGPSVHFFKRELPCRPCRQRGEVCAKGNMECLSTISVDDVAAKVREIVPVRP